MDMRDATPEDLPAIEAIYRPHVLRGLASFEEAPPDVEELSRRYADVRARGLPYLVAVQAGYGYCAPYRLRSAYRYTLEDSVYIKEANVGRGIGSRLLGELIVLCERLDYRQLIAVIGDSANAASIALHARHGFLRAGTFRSVGYKFGRWVDSVQMQRPLGRGDLAPPST
jgi:L-amino acid N-acyltransferase YncA